MKIQIYFNQEKHNEAVSELNSNLERYIKCIEAIEKITSKKELKTLEEINQHIYSVTNFENILLSSQLLNVQNEYSYLLANLNAVDVSKIDFKDNVPSVKESALKQVKEDATQYLSDAHIEEYKILIQVAKELNKLPNPNKVKYLSRDYSGKYTINLMGLENSNKI